MALEAFANVLANIGRSIGETGQRNLARQQALEDRDDARRYAEQQRGQIAQEQLTLRQKELDQALAQERKRITALTADALAAEAQASGVLIVGVDGRPRPETEIRKDILAFKEAEKNALLDRETEAELNRRGSFAGKANDVQSAENAPQIAATKQLLADTEAELKSASNDLAQVRSISPESEVAADLEAQAFALLGVTPDMSPVMRAAKLKQAGLTEAAVRANPENVLMQAGRMVDRAKLVAAKNQEIRVKQQNADVRLQVANQTRIKLLDDAVKYGIVRPEAVAPAAPAIQPNASPGVNPPAAPSGDPFSAGAAAPASSPNAAPPSEPYGGVIGGIRDFFTKPNDAYIASQLRQSASQAREAGGGVARWLGGDRLVARNRKVAEESVFHQMRELLKSRPDQGQAMARAIKAANPDLVAPPDLQQYFVDEPSPVVQESGPAFMPGYSPGSPVVQESGPAQPHAFFSPRRLQAPY